jgi:hypothetical protein
MLMLADIHQINEKLKTVEKSKVDLLEEEAAKLFNVLLFSCYLVL